MRDRAAEQIAEIDRRLRRGEISRDEWHRQMRRLIEPAYLSAADALGGSGYTGTPQQWRRARSLIVELMPHAGTFLDVGCANGLLMESVAEWAGERDVAIEPYGVDISEALVSVARRRLPQWAARLWVGNAATWDPPRRFDYVRTGLDYVPAGDRAAYVERLREEFVGPGGRLIIGTHSFENSTGEELAHEVEGYGVLVADVVERPKPGTDVTYQAISVVPA
ncbi:methyltransferase domain-containing protein [Epidermidibacterium keratini]|uniref:Methyltransferase domain-containing protein n=1 Tax=Epidermidibacterium keratini TaxID=1891644 RepID=A0A7L4YL97_9ACTN|nr:class I SAM-dependent methyltransferase [Epidermidibacterium keratini]QHB99899.1 methyltransferase domain-containing protein [Epidermidibacterium keratini]